MELNKNISILILVVASGCSTVSAPQRNVYEQGYRAGVKEQMDAIAAKFEGGNFPYYHWAAPIVQEVKVPAHIEQGVFIPAHNELVMIKPGEWMKNPSYPIQSQENKNYEDNSEHHGMSDITFTPNS